MLNTVLPVSGDKHWDSSGGCGGVPALAQGRRPHCPMPWLAAWPQIVILGLLCFMAFSLDTSMMAERLGALPCCCPTQQNALIHIPASHAHRALALLLPPLQESY